MLVVDLLRRGVRKLQAQLVNDLGPRANPFPPAGLANAGQDLFSKLPLEGTMRQALPRLSATRAAKQGDTALPIDGRSNTGLYLGFGSLTVVAARAFLDERAVEPKQARHPLMAEMGHEHFGLPVEVDRFTATSKEGLIASADETQRLV